MVVIMKKLPKASETGTVSNENVAEVAPGQATAISWHPQLVKSATGKESMRVAVKYSNPAAHNAHHDSSASNWNFDEYVISMPVLLENTHTPHAEALKLGAGQKMAMHSSVMASPAGSIAMVTTVCWLLQLVKYLFYLQLYQTLDHTIPNLPRQPPNHHFFATTMYVAALWLCF